MILAKQQINPPEKKKPSRVTQSKSSEEEEEDEEEEDEEEEEEEEASGEQGECCCVFVCYLEIILVFSVIESVKHLQIFKQSKIIIREMKDGFK